MTDCDTRCSENFVQRVIGNFEGHGYRLSGMAGKLEFEVEEGTQHKEAVEEAFHIMSGGGYSRSYEGGDREVRKQGITYAGANLITSTRCIAKVGGVPHLKGGEDAQLGKRLESL